MASKNVFKEKTAGVIRYSCGILFLLFSFCYLYFVQGDVLAEAQYVYSKGVTTYSLHVGAILIPLVLLLVQWLVSLVTRLPASWHALSYVPSVLLLTVLTDVNHDTMHHFSLGAWAWVAPLIIVLFVGVVVFVKRLSVGNVDGIPDLKSQLYPNYIVLLVLFLVCGSVPSTTDIYHYELRAERLIYEGDYEGASKVGEHSLRSSMRLEQLRMFALAKQGMLAERIFEYPHYFGSKGILNVADTVGSRRVDNEDICFALGAICGKSIRSTERFLQRINGVDSLQNKMTRDYHLCYLLLDKRVKEFAHILPQYYNLSSPEDLSSLPKAYKEALLIIGDREDAHAGSIMLKGDSLASLNDDAMVARFNSYDSLKVSILNERERINRTHREYGDTYWWYYEYSDKAEGELKVQKTK